MQSQSRPDAGARPGEGDGARGAVGGARAAGEKYQQALDDYDAALRLDPKLIEAYNARAWLRATSADGQYRDGSLAVDDATKA